MTDMTNIFVTHKRASFRIFAAAALLFAVLLIFAAPASAEVDVWNGTIASGFASGNGSESEPYIIKTGEQLAYLAQEINNGSLKNKYYKLESDIDLANLNWTSIGGMRDNLSDTTKKYFTGTFDGAGHTIYNLSVNMTDKYGVGLFGESKGTVKNLSIQNAEVIGYGVVGAISGQNYENSIENCTVTNATITCTRGGTIGGITGNNRGSIENCTVTNATVIGNILVGGITGQLTCSNGVIPTVSGCTVVNTNISDNINSESNNHYDYGGVVGRVYSSNDIYTSSISNCSLINVMINGILHSGGIIGSDYGNSTITNCVVTGCINCNSYGGGVIGFVNTNAYSGLSPSITIENCFVLLKEMAGNNIYHISPEGSNVTLKNNTVWVGLSDEPMETDAETNTTYAYAENFWNNHTFFSTLGDKWGSKSGYPIPVLTDHPTPQSTPNYLNPILTMTYNENGGDGEAPMSNHTKYAVNEPESLDTGSGLSKEGYTFTGWNTKKDGTGDPYEKGDVIKLTESVTLYAQYTQNVDYLLVLPDSITLIQKSNGYAEATENISLQITVNETHAQNLTVSVKSSNTWKLINGTENIAYTLNVTDWQNNIHNSSASSDNMTGILTLYPNTLTEELNSEYNSTLYFKTSKPPQFGKTFTDTLTFTVESETIQRTSVST